jgi:hypothetical protein
MAAANPGCKPRCCGAQRKRSGGHETKYHAGRSSPSRGLPRLIENLSRSAIGVRRFKSGSGTDQPDQVCSLITCEFPASGTRHKDATCFGAQLGIGCIGSTVRPQQPIDLVGQKSRFALRGPLNRRGSHRGVGKNSHPAQYCPEDHR